MSWQPLTAEALQIIFRLEAELSSERYAGLAGSRIQHPVRIRLSLRVHRRADFTVKSDDGPGPDRTAPPAHVTARRSPGARPLVVGWRQLHPLDGACRSEAKVSKGPIPVPAGRRY